MTAPVNARRRIPPLVEPPLIRGVRRHFCVTYDGPNCVLPMDEPRSCEISTPNLWSWLYHCHRVFAPFPPPHPNIPLPFSDYVWLRPDGFPILKGRDQALEKYRVRLHHAMAQKSKTAKDRVAISRVFDLPLVNIPSPLLDVGFRVGRSF